MGIESVTLVGRVFMLTTVLSGLITYWNVKWLGAISGVRECVAPL
jgi:hypothetical protein